MVKQINSLFFFFFSWTIIDDTFNNLLTQKLTFKIKHTLKNIHKNKKCDNQPQSPLYTLTQVF